MWEGGEGKRCACEKVGKEMCMWGGEKCQYARWGEGGRCARSLLEEASSQAHFLFLHVGGKRNRAWDEATSSLPSYMSREQVNLYPSFPHEPGDKARVEVLSLPHLTNNSDTLVGVQIDNWRKRNKSPQCCSTCTHARSEVSEIHKWYSTCAWKRVHVLHVASIIQYVYVNTWLMFMR